MGSLHVEEMTSGKFNGDTKESGLHAYRYAFATDSGKLNDDGVDLAKHYLNNETTMDGVVPSTNVASGINNGTQDEKNGLKNSATNPNKGTSYANLFTGESRRKSVNFRTLITSAGNRIDVAVPVKSIRAISERFVNTAYGFSLGKRVANLVVKLHGVPVTAFSEDGLSAFATKLGTPLMLDSYKSDMCMQS
ncbi:hypothetical protein Tco_0000391 [Tanacetum coccineum]